MSYKLFWVGFILGKEIKHEGHKGHQGLRLLFFLCVLRALCGEKVLKMTINDQYNKWKETTLKKSLEKFKERKERFE